MESHNRRLSLADMTSLMFFVTTSLLGFNSVIPTAVASPIVDNNITTGGATIPSPSMSDNSSLNVTNTNVEIGEKPFAVALYTPVIKNLINETQQVQISLEGSTTLTLPSSTETITTKDTGEGVITSLPGGGIIRAQIQMSVEDESESVTLHLTEYHLDEIPTAISLAYFSTNSTGIMAPFNNMIAIALDEEQPNGDVIARFFEWEDSREFPTAINSINNLTLGG